MKYLDFASLLAGDPARIAFLSTFQFDPDFFERRILRCDALAKARRIVVFLDARQWSELLRGDVPARWLNRRYLVVPVPRSTGVFHPKAHLLLKDSGVDLICGSNNLTRSGCSSNLELLNAIRYEFASVEHEDLDVARETFAFFKRAVLDVDEGIARILTEWTDDTETMFPWLRDKVAEQPQRTAHFIHTYGGSIWDRLVQHMGDDEPKEFIILSPFHDSDVDLCRRVVRRCPRAQVELIVQQGYTRLSVGQLKPLPTVHLSEIQNTSRRVHAKLIAWRGGVRGGCVVGSANFTSAAFDGRNVEACLLLSEPEALLDALFDQQLSKRPIALDDFEAGTDEEPGPPQEPQRELRLASAILDAKGRLRVHYSHGIQPPPASLRVALRVPGEALPRVSMSLRSAAAYATETLVLSDDALADAHGTVLATLVADDGGVRVESLPVWVIQEHRLTYEPAEGTTSSKGRIEETGEGLPAFLDELGSRDGMAAVVEYLRHLNIRFHDGGATGPVRRQFRLKIRDPFRADQAPDWLDHGKKQVEDLERAILDFVERHQKRRLCRHISRGNINGVENFLDIFRTLVELMYRYHRRGVVKGARLVGKLCTLVPLACAGGHSGDDAFAGYLGSVAKNIGGDVTLLRDTCEASNYLAEVRAALLVAQGVRFEFDDSKTLTRPREALPTVARAVDATIVACHLTEPSANDVQRALDGYGMFSADEISRLLSELPV